MITLGLAQVVYFLVGPDAVHRRVRTGCRGSRAGRALGLASLSTTTTRCTTSSTPLFLAGFWLIYRTIHSPFGHVLRSIRENEPRALSLGYDVDRYKLLAFVISAGLSGLAGAAEGARPPVRDAHRRALAQVGRGGADDAPRRDGHGPGPVGRRARRGLAGELPSRASGRG